MADDTLKGTLGTPEPGGVSRKGRAGEYLTIDQDTFEIKGVDSGTVYGKGRNLQEALGLQTQIQSGGTPTVSGRPDLYGVSPLPTEEVKPIEGAGGQPVTPRVATLGELEQAAAGTLESFNKATGAPPLPPREKDKKFAEALNQTVQAGADAGREKLFATGADGVPQDFDTQLLVQKGILLAAALGEHVTPEELRFLSPDQQNLIRSGKKEALIAHAGGLQSVISGRKQQRDEEEEKQRQAERDSLTRLKTLKDMGFLGSLDSAAVAQLASETGIDPNELQTMVDEAREGGGIDWELRTDPDGNLIKVKFDPGTGEYQSEIVQRKTRTSGSGSSTTFKDITQDDGSVIRVVSDKAGNVVSRTQIIEGQPSGPPADVQLGVELKNEINGLVAGGTTWGEWNSTEVPRIREEAHKAYGEVLPESEIDSLVNSYTDSVGREGGWFKKNENEAIVIK